MTHPTILGYKETFTKSFPLILVVGREPNNQTRSDGSLGHLPFNEKGIDIDGKKYTFARCSFWNIPFGIFGKINGYDTKSIKKMFEEKNACPIVFTDASPIGILNENNKKWGDRNRISESDFSYQIDKIFSKKEVIDRVKLVLFSGLNHPSFDFFRKEFLMRSKEYNFLCNEYVPFFYGTNSRKIDESIGIEERSILKSIFQEFSS